MAISFIAAASTTGTATTTVVNVPAGTANDDVMVAFAHGIPVTTAPAGWTLIRDYPSSENGRSEIQAWYRVAASEPASYTWTQTAFRSSAAILTYRNVDTTLPINAVTVGTDVTSTTHVAPSATATRTPTMLVAGVGAVSSSSLNYTASGTMTERVDLAGARNLGVFDEAISSTGATGTRSVTISATCAYVAISVLLADTAAPPAVTATSGLLGILL